MLFDSWEYFVGQRLYVCHRCILTTRTQLRQGRKLSQKANKKQAKKHKRKHKLNKKLKNLIIQHIQLIVNKYHIQY